MIKPSKLRRGDTIGIISPSWGGAGLYPHRVEQGIHHLEALGFQVKIAPNALKVHGIVSDTPENRVGDILQLFADPTIKAIITTIGGDHSCHLLPLLDYELIRQNPKIIIGFSDVTVLNTAIWQKTGLITFNGPALLTDFAEQPKMFDYTEKYVLKAICQAEPIGLVEPSTWWTEEFQDWGKKADLERPRYKQEASGWHWLKPGIAEGILMGGCLESLQHLRGTPYWPDWQDTIMFIEVSENPPDPETIDGILMDYENMDVLKQLKGLIVGRSRWHNEAEKQRMHDILLTRTKQYDFPIITEMDFGHTAPQFTLPRGCRARINTPNQRFEIIEAAVV